MTAVLARVTEPLTLPLDRAASAVLPTLARLVFAGVLLVYYLHSAGTKHEGLSLSLGAYAQIYPKAMAAAGFDITQMSAFQTLVVTAGTIAEYVLPILLLVGLLTRLSALGMIGFVLVQTATDIWGHDAGPETIGTWFDRLPDAALADQRALWIMLLLIPVFHGGGPLSLDRLFLRR
ncbi:DoxX family membrane protein [Aestuariibius sp. 2305UL40-4]|uniref:DoxX family membrane protein n=1 Tax=Aestuariibius violaceus TaxID=3234132 RepID=UPI00345E956E